ncbi:MAG: hypothetical protein KF858_03225 [Candidatus Sumerlaeia bacterium]|nr:hypothetical protein [Candidatus Sumerlaeia bacterium]
MCDADILRDQLLALRELIERITLRMRRIAAPADFTATSDGEALLDSICLVLLAIGEAVKRLDRVTEGKYLPRYPEIVFLTCTVQIPELGRVVDRMIRELDHRASP